jgi:hypothetical protein
MVELLRPSRGGFLRPFGCGEFIRDFLLGKGPYGSLKIDPKVGAPQATIFRQYKLALMREIALDKATRIEERTARKENRGIDPEKIQKLADDYFAHLPYKTLACRFHSFVVYFSDLQKLRWVEATGKEEPSDFQEHFPPGPSRKYFRITKTGREASDIAWRNPHRALYPRGK